MFAFISRFIKSVGHGFDGQEIAGHRLFYVHTFGGCARSFINDNFDSGEAVEFLDSVFHFLGHFAGYTVHCEGCLGTVTGDIRRDFNSGYMEEKQ